MTEKTETTSCAITRAAEYVRKEYNTTHYDMGPRLKPWQKKAYLTAAFAAAALGAASINTGMALGGVALVASSFVILTLAFSRPRNIIRGIGNWQREEDAVRGYIKPGPEYAKMLETHKRAVAQRAKDDAAELAASPDDARAYKEK